MENQSVNVSSMPDAGSPSRVAFDLMLTIADKEKAPTADKAREYYLDLFTACRDRVYYPEQEPRSSREPII